MRKHRNQRGFIAIFVAAQIVVWSSIAAVLDHIARSVP